MEFEMSRFVVALLVFPILISPCLYIRLVKRESVEGFREKIIFPAFSKQLNAEEHVKLISKRGSYANLIIYVISAPLSVLTSTIDLYPFPVLFSLCCWFAVGCKIINDYHIMIVLTDRAIYVFNYLHNRTSVYTLDAITSVTAISKMYWWEVVINGIRIQAYLEVDNAYEFAKIASSLVAKATGGLHDAAK
jgi:hypothetical protein